VLNSPGNGPGGIINHLGVEVSSTEDVTQVETRLSAAGLATEAKPGTTCCYALQDKVGAHDPDGLARELPDYLPFISPLRSPAQLPPGAEMVPVSWKLNVP
jgi:Glyoxalase/Bleomycin resistance protein/Dioxygenase superfamily